jgi:hypothetical protein
MSILEIITTSSAAVSALVACWALYETRRAINSQVEWQQRVTEKQLYFQIVVEEWKEECEELKRLNPQERRPSLRERLTKAGVLKHVSDPNEAKR